MEKKFFYCSGWLNIRSFLRLVVPQRRSSSRSRHFFLPSLINTPIKFHWIENYFPKSIPQFQELSTETHILVSRISHQSQRHGEKTRKKMYCVWKNKVKQKIVNEVWKWDSMYTFYYSSHSVAIRTSKRERWDNKKCVGSCCKNISLFFFFSLELLRHYWHA